MCCLLSNNLRICDLISKTINYCCNNKTINSITTGRPYYGGNFLGGFVRGLLGWLEGVKNPSSSSSSPDGNNEIIAASYYAAAAPYEIVVVPSSASAPASSAAAVPEDSIKFE